MRKFYTYVLSEKHCGVVFYSPENPLNNFKRTLRCGHSIPCGYRCCYSLFFGGPGSYLCLISIKVSLPLYRIGYPVVKDFFFAPVLFCESTFPYCSKILSKPSELAFLNPPFSYPPTLITRFKRAKKIVRGAECLKNTAYTSKGISYNVLYVGVIQRERSVENLTTGFKLPLVTVYEVVHDVA